MVVAEAEVDPRDQEPIALIVIEIYGYAAPSQICIHGQHAPTMLRAYPKVCPSDMHRGSPAEDDDIILLLRTRDITYDQLDPGL